MDSTRVEQWLAVVKNHKAVAALVIVGIAVGGLATLAKSMTELRVFFAQTFAVDPPPKWITQLRLQPMLPKHGIAGVRIGQTEAEVRELLGQPTRDLGQIVGSGQEIFLDARPGTVHYYGVAYEYQGVFLGVYTDRDSRRVQSFRLMCRSSDVCKLLPSYKGIAVGGVSTSLDGLGPQLGKSEHLGCSSPLGKATTYAFDGISVSVCNDTKVIETIDIS